MTPKRISLLIRNQGNLQFLFLKHTGRDVAESESKSFFRSPDKYDSECTVHSINFESNADKKLTSLVISEKGIIPPKIAFVEGLTGNYRNIDKAYIWRDKHQKWKVLS